MAGTKQVQTLKGGVSELLDMWPINKPCNSMKASMFTLDELQAGLLRRASCHFTLRSRHSKVQKMLTVNVNSCVTHTGTGSLVEEEGVCSGVIVVFVCLPRCRGENREEPTHVPFREPQQRPRRSHLHG